MTVPVKTRICRSCSHEFSTLRPRCPACGTPAPMCKHGMVEGLCAVCTGTVRATVQRFGKEKKEKVVKPKRDRGPSCIACDRRVKPGHKRSTTCPHCNEPIHKACLDLHRTPCLQFQIERDDELDKLKQGR